MRTFYSVLDELLASPTEPLPKSQRVHQLTKMYESLRAVESSESASVEDLWTCSDFLNLMDCLVDAGVAKDTDGLIEDSMAAIIDAHQRFKNGFGIRLSGAALQAVRALLDSYADIIELVPARTMIKCHRQVEKRMFEIRAGKKRKNDYIL